VGGSGAVALNAATGCGTSIRELAETMVAQFDLPPVIYEDVAEGEVSELVTGRVRLPAELEQMVLASDLAAERFGWKAEVELPEGLASEMEWLQANLHRWDAMRY
jgi:nucleoside-diphosphate-sugar epimerase